MEEKTSIFRKKAVDNVGLSFFGSVSHRHQMSSGLLIGLPLIGVIGIIVFICFFSYTRKERVFGILESADGLIEIMPLQSGIISEVRVTEGQEVRKGDILFSVVNDIRNSSNMNSDHIIDGLRTSKIGSFKNDISLKKEKTRKKELELQHKSEILIRELSIINELISLQRKRIRLGEKSELRSSKLRNQKFISEEYYQFKQDDLIALRAKLYELERENVIIKRKIENCRYELDNIQIQSQLDISALQREIITLEQELTSSSVRNNFLVKAPQSGIISNIMMQVGSSVDSNKKLANLSPKKLILDAVFYIPSRTTSFISRGMKVSIRYKAFPYQKFGQFNASIYEISKSQLTLDEIPFPLNKLAEGEAIYKVKAKVAQQNVTRNGETYPLKMGMALEASILLENSKLYEWLLASINNVSIGEQ